MTPLEDLYPDLLACLVDREASVSQLLEYWLDGEVICWKVRILRDLHDWEAEIVNSFLSHICSQVPWGGGGVDRMRWCLEGSGSLIFILLQGHLWCQWKYVPLEEYMVCQAHKSEAFFLWTASWGKILTIDNLIKKVLLSRMVLLVSLWWGNGEPFIASL